MQLILASQSPRRRELLSLFGVAFSVVVADVDEHMDPALPPQQEVARVSALKARAIPCGPEDVVVAADTVVVCDGRVLGKPHSQQEAAQMLRLLSGRSHEVMTGVTVRCARETRSFTEVTQLQFRTLSEAEILRYVESGEPMDKAGAYGIQGGAALFCPHMEGDYYNVMGLPVCRLGQVLQELAPQIMGGRQ